MTLITAGPIDVRRKGTLHFVRARTVAIRLYYLQNGDQAFMHRKLGNGSGVFWRMAK